MCRNRFLGVTAERNRQHYGEKSAALLREIGSGTERNRQRYGEFSSGHWHYGEVSSEISGHYGEVSAVFDNGAERFRRSVCCGKKHCGNALTNSP